MVTLGSCGTLEMRYLHINTLEKHRVGGSILSEEGNALRTKVLLGELVFSVMDDQSLTRGTLKKHQNVTFNKPQLFGAQNMYSIGILFDSKIKSLHY